MQNSTDHRVIAFDPNSGNAILSRVLTELSTLSGEVKQLRAEMQSIREEQATSRGKALGVTAAASFISGLIAWLGTLWATKH